MTRTNLILRLRLVFVKYSYYTISSDAGQVDPGFILHPFLFVLFLSYCQGEALWSILNGK